MLQKNKKYYSYGVSGSKNRPKDLISSFESIEEARQILDIKEQKIFQKSLTSDNPADIIKAMTRLNDPTQYSPSNTFNNTNVHGGKSLLVDPYGHHSASGYLQKIRPIDNGILRNMAKSPFVKAIVETRIEQVASFGSVSEDKDDIGWMIVKRNGEKVGDTDRGEIDRITKFVSETGVDESRWVKDDFDKFLRKITQDTLTLDALTFEIVRTKNDKLYEFFATDAGTFYFADPRELFSQKTEINGHMPLYVQVFQGQVINNYYPWELAYGIRNPTSDIYQNGYGRSELEDLINVVTWQLYGMQYTGSFFSRGSAPKGILKLSGNVNERRLAEFKQQWAAQVQGIKNAWKTPIMEADKMEWVDLQRNNRDMEFSSWIEFLTKILCGVYKIDPSEIGMPMSGGEGGKSMFSDDTKQRQLFSKEKGLKPLLKFIEQKVDKYIVQQLNPNYKFIFTGVNFSDASKELESDIKKVGNFMGYKEIRRKHNLPDDIGKDDLILNPIFMQSKMAAQQGGSMGAEDQYNEEESGDYNSDWMNEGENPFLKSMNEATETFIQTLKP